MQEPIKENGHRCVLLTLYQKKKKKANSTPEHSRVKNEVPVFMA